MDPLADGLSLEDSLPLRWHRCESLPQGTALERINAANESFLRALATWEESPAVHSDHGDEHAELHAELNRLDMKLGLLLDMLGQVLSRQVALPARVAVRLGGRGVAWSGESIPQAGELVQVELYLHPRYPQTLELPGTVVSAEPCDRGHHRASVAFHGMSEAVQAGLEKLIFRHHRRSIASQRASRPPEQ